MPGISLNISDESHEGWTRFAQEHGVSLAVLFEVMGRHLNKGGILRQRALDDLVKEARELTHERRRAGGPRRKTQA